MAKPKEPQSIGALVEDKAQRIWARKRNNMWTCLTSPKKDRAWGRIKAVTVHYHGLGS